MSIDRNRVHQLLDELDHGQLTANAQLLEVSLANAHFEEEPATPEETAALNAAHAAIQRGEGTPHEEIMREFGLTSR